jgi:hypothetical protein
MPNAKIRKTSEAIAPPIMIDAVVPTLSGGVFVLSILNYRSS